MLVTLVIGLALGQSTATPRFEWKVPEAMGRIEVSGETIADGVPVRMRVVQSRANYNYLLQWFVDYFRTWGFYVAPPEKQLKAPMVPMLTALDTKTQMTYTVIFQASKDGTLSLVLAEADHSKQKVTPAGGDFAPLPEGASDIFRTSLEGAQSLNFTIAQPPEKVKAFYREKLLERGYVEKEGAFGKDGTLIQVTTSRIPNGNKTSVSVTLFAKERSGEP